MKTVKANYIMNTVSQYGEELIEMMKNPRGTVLYDQHRSTADQVFNLLGKLIASEVTDRPLK